MAKGQLNGEPEFLFVNYAPTIDADSRPDRRAINAHSQRAFQRTRREQRAKTFRVAVWSPNSQAGTSGKEPPKAPLRLPWTPRASSESSADSPKTPSPLTLLQKGSSDPFNALAIPVDPSVTGLMAFLHDCIIPSAFHLEVATTRTTLPPVAMEYWNNATSALSDNCTAYSLLASLSIVLALTSRQRDMAKRALVYKNKSSSLLRRRIHDATDENSGYDELYWPILRLLGAEVASQDGQAANLHAMMLARLFEKAGGLSAVDPKVVTEFMWQEIHRATIFLQPTAINLDEWIPVAFPESGDPKAKTSLFEQVEMLASAKTLDSSIEDSSLRTLFLDVRKSTEVLKWATSQPPNATGSTFAWPMTHSHVCIGRLMNHYIDVTRGTKDPASRGSRRQKLAEAYTCLAAAYWTRSCFGVADIRIGAWLSGGGAVTHDTGLRLLPRLRELLLEDQMLASPGSPDPYGRVRLWALYVGTVAEQRGSIRTRLLGEEDWFTRNFAEQAGDLRLGSWEEIEKVLERFLHSDSVQPDGSVWFAEGGSHHHDLDRISKLEESDEIG